jgi:hypothetical protein
MPGEAVGDNDSVAERSAEAQQVIEDCLDLYAITKETVAYCLEHGGSRADGALITTLFTCSDTCRGTAEFIALDARLVFQAAVFCAHVCDYAAEACDNVGAGDEQLSLCAEAARECAASSRRLAALGTVPAEERELR